MEEEPPGVGTQSNLPSSPPRLTRRGCIGPCTALSRLWLRSLPCSRPECSRPEILDSHPMPTNDFRRPTRQGSIASSTHIPRHRDVEPERGHHIQSDLVRVKMWGEVQHRPDFTLGHSSPDSRCRTFVARGEGRHTAPGQVETMKVKSNWGSHSQSQVSG